MKTRVFGVPTYSPTRQEYYSPKHRLYTVVVDRDAAAYCLWTWRDEQEEGRCWERGEESGGDIRAWMDIADASPLSCSKFIAICRRQGANERSSCPERECTK